MDFLWGCDIRSDLRLFSSAPYQRVMNEDVLQLDQQLKATKRAKIAKLDQDRILGPKGLPYIVKNHHKLAKILNKKHPNARKIDVELQNMSSILQFYQLWSHTLYPKAKFKDCIDLMRSLPNRAPGLRVYRKQLIELELEKLRAERGIINVDIEPIERTSDDIVVSENGEDQDPQENEFVANRLFVGDDDLYETPANIPRPELEDINTTLESISKPQLEEISTVDSISKPQLEEISAVDSISPPQLDDIDTTIDNSGLESISPPHLEEIPPESDHDEELEIMRQLGM